MCAKSLAYLALPAQPPSACHKIHEVRPDTPVALQPEVLYKEG